MSLKVELKKVGLTKQDLADRLGVNYRTVLRMGDEVSAEVSQLLAGVLSAPDDELPEELDEPVELSSVLSRRVMSRGWKLLGEKVRWLGSDWGHGSEWDFEFSAAKLSQVERMVNPRESGLSDEAISDLKKGILCPIIVDEIESKYVNSEGYRLRNVPFRCNPWRVTTKVGDYWKESEYGKS